MAPSWVHCNVCMEQGGSSLFISSCGKVVCINCKPSLSSTHCDTCRGPCTRTIQLNSRAPQEVLRLFEDPSSHLKSMMKCLDFQSQQKKRLLNYHRNLLNEKEEQVKAILKRKEEDHNKFLAKKNLNDELGRKIQKAKAYNQRLFSQQLQQERSATFPESLDQSMAAPPAFDDDEDEDDNDNAEDQMQMMMSAPAPAGLGATHTVAGHRLSQASPQPNYDDLSSPLPSQVFLEMKTPAAWHKKVDNFVNPNHHQMKLKSRKQGCSPLMQLEALENNPGHKAKGHKKFFTPSPRTPSSR